MVRILIFHIILIFFISSLNANDTSLPKYKFKYLTMQNGLSNYKVNAICKDSSGFLWFGTNEGLNRYDGYTFKTYLSEKNDSNSLVSNTIRKIINKSSYELVIATDYGAYIYNSKQDVFIPINCAEEENCKELTWSVCTDKYGIIWLGTINGLFYKTADSDKAVKYSGGKQWFANSYIKEVEVLQDNKLYIGTRYDGLIIIDIETNNFVHYKNDPANPNSISGNWIEAIFEDSRHNIWIGTNDDGLNLFDPKSNTFKKGLVNYESWSRLRIRDITEDKNGSLWLGTSIGLFVKTPNDELFNIYASNNDINSTLYNSSIYDILIDNNDILWLGTYSGGVNYCDMHQKEFKAFRPKKDDNKYLNDRVIFSICEDENNIWVATEKGGLNMYDKKTGLFKYYNLQKHNVRSNNLKVIIQEANKHLWIGTYRGGLVHFDPKSEIFTAYTNNTDDTNSLVDNMVYSLTFDKDSNLWVGTRDGVDKFNIKTKQFTHYTSTLKQSDKQSSQVAYKLYCDSKNNIWMGGSILGLFIFNKEKQIFESYDSVFHATGVNSIYEDRRKNLWVGGSHGLFYIDNQKDTIIHYTKEDGLPINSIFSIEADHSDNIWLSTTIGISKFIDAVNKPYIPNFMNYRDNDGISVEQFILNPNNSHVTNTIYFGGVNGFIAFDPERITINPIEPVISFTNLTIFNEDVKINKSYNNKIVLSESISTAKEINLSYKHKIFTIEFAALHFSNPINNLYRYRLEGFEDNWNYTTSNKRFATYTNLKGGKYTFVVYGSNNDGIWSKEPATIDIIITPPLWNTLGFYILVCILVLSIILLIIRLRTNELNKRAQELEKAKLKAEESDKLKSAFLANMSHEIRTPMNSILGFSNFLIEETDREVQKEYVEIIQNSSESLLVLINDILDISKIESNQLKIFNEPFSVYQILNELYTYYKNTNENANLQIIFENNNDTSLVLNTDKVRFKQIFTNLINNAVKFTEKGFVHYGYEIQSDKVLFYVKDTGIGIAEDNIPLIFNYFGKIEEDNKVLFRGTGIGLSIVKSLVKLMGGDIWVTSQPKIGSSFYFHLPLPKEEIKNEFETEPAAGNQTSKFSFKIAVAEDEENNFNLIKLMLGKFGIQTVFWAKNGSQIIDYIKENPSGDLAVFMDIKMPEKDGIIALEEIRAFNAKIPVIALTAFATLPEEKEILTHSFNGFLSKPVKLEKLQQILTNTQKILHSK